MEPNSFLVVIRDTIRARRMDEIRPNAEKLEEWLKSGGEEPIWGWSGLMTKADFKLLLVDCGECSSPPKLINKGLFGYECTCSSCGTTGAGNEVLDSVKDWISKI